jgi:presqualene diphosphate synthase
MNILAALPDTEELLGAEVRKAGSSFYWAMRLLSPERRTGVFAVYAFCRAVDDIADGAMKRDDRLAALDAWRQRIDALYAGDMHSEPMLARTVALYSLKQADFHAVIDGMEMDVRGPLVAPPLATLELYCDCVAGAVGKLCNPVFGDTSSQADVLAIQLGRALQITNIIRDVRDDAIIGRLYVPEELLAEQNVKSRSPIQVLKDRNLPNALRRLGNVADKAFAQADGAIDRCDPRAMKAPMVMMHVYRRNWRMMRDAGWRPDDFKSGGRMDKLAKMVIALRYGVLGLKGHL